MIKRFIGPSLAALGIVTGAFAVPRSASACGGGDWEFSPRIEIDMRPQGLETSEKELGDGQPLASAARVIRMFPSLRSMPVGMRPLLDRAHRTLAIAVVRSDGALALDRQVPRNLLGAWEGKTDADRAANLRWAADTMRRLNAKAKGDPKLETDLGEALAKVDASRDEALALLGKLADKDLMASPEGYAALARLRQRSGDAGGSEVALQRCEAMAKSKAICGRDRVTVADGTNGPS